MTLYDILKERGCINILKLLYDEEVILKRSYTLKKTEIESQLKEFNISDSLIILEQDKLVNSEDVDGEVIVSINEQGKNFIEVFDNLVKLMKGELKEEKKKPEIQYDLNSIEQKVLLFIYKITKEEGQAITIKKLAQELYPYQDSSKKTSAVGKYVNKLDGLNLIEKSKEGRKYIIKPTESGIKVVRNQLYSMI